MFDIIGVGDADIDIMLKVDHIPGHDEKVLGQMLGKFPGGMVANYLSAAAAFGAKCGAVVSVGEDDFGRLTLGDLEKRGVDISHSIVRPGEDTYFTVTNLDASGEKSMSICQTAAISPYPEEVDFDYLAEAKYVHMIGTYPHLVLPVGREAKKRGVRVSLDFEPESDRMTPEQKAETLSLAYIVFPNEEGLACYVGHRDLERGAREMLAQGPEIVVVTRGAAGCEVFTKEAHFAVPAFRVPVRDTTGAGDTFNAVFVSCLAREYPLERCAWLATAAAAIQIQQVGSRTGLADEAAAKRLLRAHGIRFSVQD